MFRRIEFQPKVQNGLIQVPDEYKQELNKLDDIKVIILVNNKSHKQKDIIDELTENPVPVDGFLSSEEVYSK
ncbi:MAG: hypothetical protein KME29_39010 [Calothrix sp. FI2-JRJ7]|jgi:hypothetical protein|nr:hypothetical protein [Calothrix sp. FI2-JRJ7]